MAASALDTTTTNNWGTGWRGDLGWRNSWPSTNYLLSNWNSNWNGWAGNNWNNWATGNWITGAAPYSSWRYGSAWSPTSQYYGSYYGNWWSDLHCSFMRCTL